MARFKIIHTRKAADDTAKFEVEFLESELREGDTFKTYDTHHPMVWTILDVADSDPVILTCETPGGLEWNDQFAPAIVDTAAEHKSSAFRYLDREDQGRQSECRE